MKKLVAVLFAGIALSMTVHAADESDGGGYLGVKGGLLLFSQEFDYKDGINGGLYGGYHFNKSWAVEGEMTIPLNSASSGQFPGDLDVFTFAVYGVFRSSGKVYFKGKAGLLYEYLETSVSNVPISGDAMGISLGLGGGWRITDSLSTELEFQTIEADISMLSLGVLYWF